MKTHLGWHFPDHDEFFFGRAKPYPRTKYQHIVLNKSLELVTNFHCAIDAGANIGLQSVRFSEKFKTVYAFEPVSTNFECLKENTKIFDNVILHQCALGNSTGTMDIRAPVDMKHCGAFSLEKFVDDTQDYITETVNIKQLDEFNLTPGLIKVDVEGYESKVLEGAVETIKKFKPVLILEHTVKTIKRLMPVLDYLKYTCVFAHEKDKIWIYNENSANRS